MPRADVLGPDQRRRARLIMRSARGPRPASGRRTARELLLAGGALDEPALRSLDAIHIVAAIALSPLDGFVSYDERQAAAARLAGLRTFAPTG
jgi:predicted nucleic acid-binding protein